MAAASYTPTSPKVSPALADPIVATPEPISEVAAGAVAKATVKTVTESERPFCTFCAHTLKGMKTRKYKHSPNFKGFRRPDYVPQWAIEKMARLGREMYTHTVRDAETQELTCPNLKTYKCFKCGECGHTPSYCHECEYCHTRGHKEEQCPKKRADEKDVHHLLVLQLNKKHESYAAIIEHITEMIAEHPDLIEVRKDLH